MSTVVHVVARIAALPKRTADVKALLLNLAAESRREDGCLRYEVLADEQDPNVFVLVEEWQSSGALEAHNATRHVGEALGRVPALVSGVPELRRYHKLG
jgi:quinol monooxygenase YgiN